MPDRMSLMLDRMITAVDEGFSFDGIVSVPEAGLEDVTYRTGLAGLLDSGMDKIQAIKRAILNRIGRRAVPQPPQGVVPELLPGEDQGDPPQPGPMERDPRRKKGKQSRQRSDVPKSSSEQPPEHAALREDEEVLESPLPSGVSSGSLGKMGEQVVEGVAHPSIGQLKDVVHKAEGKDPRRKHGKGSEDRSGGND